MVAGGQRFLRVSRLRSSKDFQRVSREGQRLVSRAFIVLVLDEPEGRGGEEPRLGITVSKRVGRAVIRNRIKRRVREWFRRNQAIFPLGRKLVVIARAAAGELSHEETLRSLDELVGVSAQRAAAR